MVLRSKPWERLSLFESHDFILVWYKNRHGRSLNSQRIKEITSCFVQGREYFLSASTASISVRPLLIYYGLLALSRGTILLKSVGKSEASLKPSHGLEILEWGKELSHGISGILDLAVKATAGTFSEFVQIVDNYQDSGWWCSPNMGLGSYRVNFEKPSFVTLGNPISLDDILSRDPRLGSVYQETTGKWPRWHTADIVADQTSIEIAFFDFSNGPNKEVFETGFNWPAGVQINHKLTGQRLPVPNFSAIIETNDLNSVKPLLPMWVYTGGDAFNVIEDFPAGDRISELFRTYLISYALGMLVRYFPSKWMALLRNEKGDAAMPLLVAAMNLVESDFPKGIAEVLA